MNGNNELVVNQVTLATWLGAGSSDPINRPRVVTWYDQSVPGTDIGAVGTDVWAASVSVGVNSGIDDQRAITNQTMYPIFEGDTARGHCFIPVIPPGYGLRWHSRSSLREVHPIIRASRCVHVKSLGDGEQLSAVHPSGRSGTVPHQDSYPHRHRLGKRGHPQ